MKTRIKNGKSKMKEEYETQRKREKTKISFFYKKESGIKLLDKSSISAAKVVTFNQTGKVSGYIFATI